MNDYTLNSFETIRTFPPYIVRQGGEQNLSGTMHGQCTSPRIYCAQLPSLPRECFEARPIFCSHIFHISQRHFPLAVCKTAYGSAEGPQNPLPEGDSPHACGHFQAPNVNMAPKCHSPHSRDPDKEVGRKPPPLSPYIL